MKEKLITYAKENTVPYLGQEDTYFLGNAISGASGNSKGEWTFLIGPDYTCPNYISEERLTFRINHIVYNRNFSMHRLRRTGIYYGFFEDKDFVIHMFDFTVSNESYVCRCILIQNKGTERLDVEITADIKPYEADIAINDGVLQIKKDTEKWCFGNKETKNWAYRSAFIYFSTGTTIETQSECVKLNTKVTVETDQTVSCGLYHELFYTDTDEGYLPFMPSYLTNTKSNETSNCLKSIGEWNEWIKKGKYPDAIPQSKLRDVVESLLLCVKMQQNRDGGVIAGIQKYANSYVRDTHGCMRLLNISGHFEETASLILYIHSKWEKMNIIPNWWSMGSDTFIGNSFHNDASEVPAYYIFMIRDYIRYTGDSSILKTVMPSLEWAAQVQADYLISHNMTLDFNGDETEQYCCNYDGQEYGGFVNPEYAWNAKLISFPSMAAALASLEYYVTVKDGYNLLIHSLKDRINALFWEEENRQYRWAVSVEEDGKRVPHKARLTNYALLHLWLGANIDEEKQKEDVLSVIHTINDRTGILPNAPGVMEGFCGHTLGLMLYNMVLLKQETAKDILNTILNSKLLGQYGTVWEFYGPGGVPNGHNCRGFEGGILGEALIYAYSQYGLV